MQKVLFCFVAVLAIAFAQDFPQGGTLTITPVNGSNPVINTQLGISTNYNTSRNVQLFSYYVPTNALYVNVTFTNLDYSNCGYINFFMRTHGLPCSSRMYNSDYFCTLNYNPDNGISSYNNDVVIPSFTGGYLFQPDLGTTWYMGVGRYYQDQGPQTTCPYQIAINLGTCAAGQTSYANAYSTAVCVNVMDATFGMTYNFSGAQNAVFTYKYTVPQMTGMITISTTAPTSSIYVYARNYVTGSYYTDYDCYSSSYDNEVNGTYYNSFNCYTPRSGDYYIVVTDTYDNSFNGSITASARVCGSGSAGYNCSFPISAYNFMNASSMTLTIPYNSGYLSYVWNYLYFDIPANFSTNNVYTFSVVSTNSASGYFAIRRDGFPEENSYGYETSSQVQSTPAIWNLNNFDFQVPGRIYMGVMCYTSGGCTFQLSQNATQTGTSSSSSSGAMTTGMQMTTGFSNNTVTTGMQMTTGFSNTTVTTSKITTGRMNNTVTTSRLTTGATSQSESSDVAVFIPSVFVALFAAFVALF